MSRKLYFSDASPYARVIRVLLHELDLRFEGDLLNQLRPVEEFASTNPGVTIPVLEDGDRVLFDSKVISQYLLETSAVPKSNEGRAPPLFQGWFRVDNKWEDLKLLSVLESLTEAIVAAYLVGRSLGEAGLASARLGYVERHEKRISNLLDWLNDRAKPEGFIPGYFSIMDIQLIAALGFADARNVLDWRGRPNIDAMVSRYSARPSIAETVPTPRP